MVCIFQQNMSYAVVVKMYRIRKLGGLVLLLPIGGQIWDSQFKALEFSFIVLTAQGLWMFWICVGTPCTLILNHEHAQAIWPIFWNSMLTASHLLVNLVIIFRETPEFNFKAPALKPSCLTKNLIVYRSSRLMLRKCMWPEAVVENHYACA